jgi:S1-C subfamily serine protease
VPEGAGHFTRQCPQCGRSVPKQVHACRCGHALPLEATEPVTAAPAQPGTFPRGLLGWVVAAALALSLIAVLTRTKGGDTQSTALKPPSVASVSAPPAVEPAPRPAVASPPEPAPRAALTPIVAEPAASAPPPLEDVIGRAVRAVVSLRAGTTNGSGFFVTDDTLVTNEHVVSAHPSVSIRLHDGTSLTGYVAARHP